MLRRALNALLAALTVTVLVLAGITLLSPQAKPQAAKPRIVIIDDVVRTKLAKDWDKQANNPFQRERGYCVRFDTIPFGNETVYRVFAIEKPDSTFETSSDHVVFSCIDTPDRAMLHVHTPTTCENELQCVLGGSEAYECFPSDKDREEVKRLHYPFGLIQCDRKAVVFYFPQ